MCINYLLNKIVTRIHTDYIILLNKKKPFPKILPTWLLQKCQLQSKRFQCCMKIIKGLYRKVYTLKNTSFSHIVQTSKTA